MLSKKEVKDIQSLSQKKFREALNLFVAEGPKIVGEFIQFHPGQIEKIYAVKQWIENNQTIQNSVIEISQHELEKISHLQTPNQVIALIKKSVSKKPNASSFTLYLDAIQDPGNFGTIVRIADWFGIKNIVCTAACAYLYNPKVVQSSMASLGRVNIYYDEEGTWLKDQKVPVMAATLHGSSLYQHKKMNNGILIIGNESKGIGNAIIQYATQQVTIPKKGNAESLNAAVATGIILSHLLS